MRKSVVAAAAGKNNLITARVETPVRLVSLALLLAIATLACRIASFW